MEAQIKEALAKLDVKDDSQWTSDGQPVMQVMKQLTGLDGLIRADITKVAPQFSRENPVVEVAAAPTADANAATADQGEAAAPATPQPLAGETTREDGTGPVDPATAEPQPTPNTQDEGQPVTTDPAHSATDDNPIPAAPAQDENGNTGADAEVNTGDNADPVPADDAETNADDAEDTQLLGEPLGDPVRQAMLDKVINDAADRVVASEDAVAAALKEREDAKLAYDKAVDAKAQEFPPMKQAEMFAQFAAQQQANRAGGMSVQAQVETLLKQAAKSPLEQAMARNTSPNTTKRPNYNANVA